MTEDDHRIRDEHGRLVGPRTIGNPYGVPDRDRGTDRDPLYRSLHYPNPVKLESNDAPQPAPVPRKWHPNGGIPDPDQVFLRPPSPLNPDNAPTRVGRVIGAVFVLIFALFVGVVLVELGARLVIALWPW